VRRVLLVGRRQDRTPRLALSLILSPLCLRIFHDALKVHPHSVLSSEIPDS